MINKYWLLAIICFIIATVTIFIEPIGVELVNCYDENNNKINELTCERDIYPNYYIFMLFSFIGVIIFGALGFAYEIKK